MKTFLRCARSVLALFFFCFVFLGQSSAFSPYGMYAQNLLRHKPQGIVVRQDLEKVLDRLASDIRKQQGKPALSSSSFLKTSARAQALEMAEERFVGHQSRSGFSPRVRIASFFSGKRSLEAFGENAARGRRGNTVKEEAMRLMEQWMHSPGHRRNLLNANYTFVSSGVFERNGEIYAVQVFWSERSGGRGSSFFD